MLAKNGIKNFVVVFASLIFGIVYSSAFIPPSAFWGFYFIAYGIPVVIVLQLLGSLFILRIGVKKPVVLFWFICLIPSLYFITATFGLGIISIAEKETELSLLNYNVSNFANNHSTSSPKTMDASGEAISNGEYIRQISEVSADVLCLQEFYSCESSSIYNALETLSKQFPFHFLSVDTIKVNKSLHGIAIFSKLPIINAGNIFVNENLFNRSCYVDVVKNNDTIRIINVHLQSNQIKRNNPLHQKSIHQMENQSLTVLAKIKKNMVTRLSQAELVQENIAHTKYPVIVAGDFNETPYGYIYNKFRRSMNNSFTNGGSGLGFTFHSHSLFFLRIDHQFYSSQLSCSKHDVIRDFEMSDHYPLLAKYSINPPTH